MSVPRSALALLLFGLALGCAVALPVQAQSFIELHQEAIAVEEAGRYEKAAHLYERIYAISDGDITPLYSAAGGYAQAGLHNKAFQKLERVVEAGWAHVNHMKQDPALASLHENERWGELVAEAEARYASFDLNLRQELLAMEEQDQQNRVGIPEIVAQYGRHSPQGDSAFAVMAALDKPLQDRIKEVIRKRGWPGRSLVGDDGAHAAWLLVQHADTAYLREVLPLLLEAAEQGEARKAEAAYVHDRVLTNQGKPQIYGTQLQWSQGPGQGELYPIEDEANVDERRAEAKMPPLAEYLMMYGIEYVPPAEREH